MKQALIQITRAIDDKRRVKHVIEKGLYVGIMFFSAKVMILSGKNVVLALAQNMPYLGSATDLSKIVLSTKKAFCKEKVRAWGLALIFAHASFAQKANVHLFSSSLPSSL